MENELTPVKETLKEFWESHKEHYIQFAVANPTQFYMYCFDCQKITEAQIKGG